MTFKLYQWTGYHHDPDFHEYIIILGDQVSFGFTYSNDLTERNWYSENIANSDLWSEVPLGTI